jgi:hypothetical protein
MDAPRTKRAKQDEHDIVNLSSAIPGNRSGSRQKSAEATVAQRPGQCPGHGEGPNSEQASVIIGSSSQGRPGQILFAWRDMNPLFP